MRTSIMCALTLWTAAVAAACAQPTWSAFPGARIDHIKELVAVSPNECVVVQDYIYSDTVRRLDGKTGTVVPLLILPHETDRRAMSWLSRDTGLVVASQHTPKEAFVYWTYDAGATWETLRIPVGNAFLECQMSRWNSIYVHTTDTLFVVSTKTRAWKRLGFSGNPRVFFYDSLVAIAAQQWGGNYERLGRSEDGGRTWTVPAGMDHNVGVLFQARDGGLVAGWNPFFSSSDTGRSWRPLPIGPWRLTEILGIAGVNSIWAHGSSLISESSNPEPRACPIALHADAGWDVFDGNSGIGNDGRLAMWSETCGWYWNGGGTVRYTDGAWMRQREISVSDFSTRGVPRIRVTVSFGRHGFWSSARLLRRKTGVSGWEPRAEFPYPTDVFWDESVDSGAAYEYNATATYADQQTVDLVSGSLATGPPLLLDLREYLDLPAGVQQEYMYHQRGTSKAWDSIRFTLQPAGEIDSARCTIVRLRETIVHKNQTDTATILYCISRDASPSIFVMGTHVGQSATEFISNYPSYSRFRSATAEQAQSPPEMLRDYFEAPPVNEYRIERRALRGQGMVLSSYYSAAPGRGWSYYDFVRTGVTTVVVPPPVPARFQVSAYPNPSRSTLSVVISMPDTSRVEVQLHSTLGAHIARLHDAVLPAGEHTLRFDRGRLATGAYFLRVTAGSRSKVTMLMIE